MNSNQPKTQSNPKEELGEERPRVGAKPVDEDIRDRNHVPADLYLPGLKVAKCP